MHDCDSVIGVNSNTPPRIQSHLQLVSATGTVTNTQQTCTSQLSNKTLAVTRLGPPMLLVKAFHSWDKHVLDWDRPPSATRIVSERNLTHWITPNEKVHTTPSTAFRRGGESYDEIDSSDHH